MFRTAPEGAFIWDELLLHFARPENGGYWPLRGALPAVVLANPANPATEAYCAKHLV